MERGEEGEDEEEEVVVVMERGKAQEKECVSVVGSKSTQAYLAIFTDTKDHPLNACFISSIPGQAKTHTRYIYSTCFA